MPQGQTVILRGERQRKLAHALVDAAPVDAVVNIREAKRTLNQNAKLWAMLSDVSRAKPGGRKHTADEWKALFMHACGHEVQFAEGLDGRPFPTGFRSSRLTVRQMSDLIEFVYAWCGDYGVQWSDDIYDERSA
jgi:hypothetical protein